LHLVSSSESGKATFDELKLSPETLAALERADYEYPSPIQAGLIPVALQGSDVIGQARTGTGKTASFAIPILEQLKPRKEVRGIQALILVPTRELAVQVREEVEKLAFGRQVTCLALYGGKPVRGQIEKLRRNPQIVVGTPGRLLDHIGRRTVRLDHISMLVLDEADRMLDIGFRPDIEKILRRCPTTRQTLLLSATIPSPVERLARQYMQDPQKLNFSSNDVTVDTIDQYYFTVDGRRKFELLVRLLKRDQPKQAIVFCRTKKGTDRIYRRLSKSTKLVACIHGDMDQKARDRAMASFRKEEARVLVATDVVGRGIDVTSISHIINFDIPHFCDDYVHRVGRAGRMGREGIAYTFVTPEEGNELTRIEMRINVQLKRDEMDRFDAVEEIASSSSQVEESTTTEPAPPAPPDSLRRGRGPRRHRRAL
jgi:ATP-dependent RNA helicase DeaD